MRFPIDGASVLLRASTTGWWKVEGLADKEKAARLRQAMEVARASTPYESWLAVAIEAGVSSTTIDNWLYGRTEPRLRQLAKVAEVLRVSPATLEAAYEGVAPPEPPITDALRDLLPELRELVVLLRAQADETILEEVRAALEARRRASVRSPDARPSVPSVRNGDGP